MELPSTMVIIERKVENGTQSGRTWYENGHNGHNGFNPEFQRDLVAAISEKVLPNKAYFPSLEDVQSAVTCELPPFLHSIVDISWDSSMGYSPEEWDGLKEIKFGQLIRVLRVKANLSVEELAEKSTLFATGNTIAALESELAIPRGEKFLDLIGCLGLVLQDKSTHLLLLKGIQSRTTISA